jgi:hypothetical protein
MTSPSKPPSLPGRYRRLFTVWGCWTILVPALALTCLVAGCPGVGDTDEDGDGDGNGGGGNGGGGGFVIGEAPLRFAVIGDYGDDDDNTRAVADMVKTWDVDFIITVGDNDYSDGAYRGTFEGLELAVGQYYHGFIGDYQGSEGPGAAENRFFPTPGDHDWGDTCDDPGGLDDYLAYFTLPGESSGNERYYDFRMGPIHFFSVHSIDGCEPDGVTADSAQARWVRDTALASDATFKIAFTHKPPYSSGARHVGEGAHMRWPWADWGFDLVLAGDDHVYERIEQGGVLYIIDGLGGVDIHEFLPTPTDGSLVRYADNYGALLVGVFDDRLIGAFVAVDGTVADEFLILDESASGGGDNGPLDPDVAPVTQGDWYRPDVTSTWHWQLQPAADGQLNTGYDVEIYDLDLFDVPDTVIDDLHATGRKILCYFSAGSYEDFRDDASEFLPSDLGNTLDGFADERWLDIRSTNVHRIMRARLDLAAARGCDGVEPDNVDGYTNEPGFPLTATDQLAYNRFLANEARVRGLSVALKNDLDQIEQLVDYFDLSVNEQCHEFDECDLLRPFIDAGKPVLNAEYADTYVNSATARDQLCSDARTANIRTLVLPLDLDDSFRYTCDP